MRHSPWICCQLGAREHYAIPRALHQVGQLKLLITDAWVPPQSVFNTLPTQSLKGLRERFHPDLANAPVNAFTTSLVSFELKQRLRKLGEWNHMITRNAWFQHHAMQRLNQIAAKLATYHSRPTLFVYSYAALELLRYAKEQGWYTVLGQIDPGPIEEQIVIAEHARNADLAPNWEPTPASYWSTWKEECNLADRIVVNSSWSRDLLIQANVEANKIQIVPLLYEPPISAANFTRTYPSTFSQERPLRVLFLGLITLRKGIAAVLEAIAQLTGEPIEFWMVGSQQITVPPQFRDHPQVRWFGQILRSETQYYYQQADVFLFPTLSDGFGLTQLEAQAWKLPIIASKFCGEVVVDSVNGQILSEVTGKAIAEILQSFLIHPKQLQNFSQNVIRVSRFNPLSLSKHLQSLVSIL